MRKKNLEELDPIFTIGENVEENVNTLVDHAKTMLQRNDITNTESAILFDVDLFLNNLLDIKQGLKRTIAHIEKEGNSDVNKAVRQMKDDLKALMGEWNDIRKQAWGSSVGAEVRNLCKFVEKNLKTAKELLQQ